jgi:preprotein translocase subunit Sec61beta
VVSRIIRDTITAGLIKAFDPGDEPKVYEIHPALVLAPGFHVTAI